MGNGDKVGRARPGIWNSGAWVLLFNNALMNAGFTMLMPLVAIHFTRDIGYTAAAVGLVLAIRQLTQQGLMLFGGALADHVGYKPVIAGGMLVRAIGFAMFAISPDYSMLMAAAIVAALGGSLFEATGKAAMAVIISPEEKARLFSLSGVFGGIGSTLGPLIGVALLRFDFTWVCIASALCFVINCILALIFLPPVKARADGEKPPSLPSMIKTIWKDAPFVQFTALMMGFWFMNNQLAVSVALYATAITSSEQAIGILYAVNAGLTILLQYPLLRFLHRRTTSGVLLTSGMALLACSLGALAFAASLPAMVACIAVFAIGRMLVEPTIYEVTADYARPTTLAAYYGFNFLALAFGGSIGNFAGGWLFDLGKQSGNLALPWPIISSIGLLVTAGLVIAQRTASRTQTHDATSN